MPRHAPTTNGVVEIDSGRCRDSCVHVHAAAFAWPCHAMPRSARRRPRTGPHTACRCRSRPVDFDQRHGVVETGCSKSTTAAAAAPRGGGGGGVHCGPSSHREEPLALQVAQRVTFGDIRSRHVPRMTPSERHRRSRIMRSQVRARSCGRSLRPDRPSATRAGVVRRVVALRALPAPVRGARHVAHVQTRAKRHRAW